MDNPWINLIVVAGFAIAWHVTRVILDQLAQYWRENKLEQMKAKNDIDKFGYDMAFQRYEACRIILAEISVEDRDARQFYSWLNEIMDEIKNRCQIEENYQPIFLDDKSRSQLQKICDENMHFLPTIVIDNAIEYLGIRKSVSSLIDVIMAPQFKSYDWQREHRLLDLLQGTVEELTDKTLPFARALDRACASMAKDLGELYEQPEALKKIYQRHECCD